MGDDNLNSNQPGWQYNAQDAPRQPDQPPEPVVGSLVNDSTSAEDSELFHWTGPDSYSVRKSFTWYLVLLVLTAVLAAAAYLLTRDKVTTAVIIVSGVLIGIYAAKKPKMIHYKVYKFGFSVNGRYYPYASYRSFSIVAHHGGLSIVLTPLKRFMPYMYIYFSHEQEEKVTSALTEVLPLQDDNGDIIERTLRRIGF